MQNAGFHPTEDRARVHLREDRGVVNIQHLNLARAGVAPGGSSTPVDYNPPISFDSDFCSGFHEHFSITGFDLAEHPFLC